MTGVLEWPAWVEAATAAAWVPPAVSCTVLIDGAVVADGNPAGPDDTHPTVLSGLSVTWGRETTIDQPDPGAATFTVMDVSGGAWATLTRIGRRVDVQAAGTAWGPASIETVTDGGFQTLPAGPAGSRVTAGPGTTVTVDAGNPADHHLWCTAKGAGAVVVTVPPARPVPASDPTGWDDIPRTQAGQHWTATVAVTRAPGAKPPRVSFVGYNKPWAAPVPVAGTWTGPDAGGVYHGGATPPGGLWLGVKVESGGDTGYRWDTVPPDLTWDTTDPAWTWDQLWGYTIDDVSILSPPGGLARTVLVFSGRITDAVAAYDPVVGATMITVTATDLLADLANRDVGAEPWPAETLTARAQRIVAASGVSGVTLLVAPGPGGKQVTRMDVDRQQVAPMLADLAAGVDAVLWDAAHLTQGQYLWIEDPANRVPAQQLAMVGGVVVIVPSTAAGVTQLSACDALLDPAQWRQTLSDIATRAAVTWKDQATTPDVTDRTYAVTNTDLESPDMPYGVRKVTVDSLVTSAAAAEVVARQLLARLSSPGWRLSGLTVPLTEPDLDPNLITVALDLLDGTTRLGRPMQITDLPWWAPVNPSAAVFVEGGRYSFDGGAWTLDLLVSAAQALGRSVRWDEVPADYTWDTFDPTITWDDLMGVGPPDAGTERRA